MQACLALREELKLRRRWPLKALIVVTKTGKELSNTLQLLKVGCNVLEAKEAKKRPKGFECKEFEEFTLCLDTKADSELKGEWEFRELVRRIQAKRKEKGLTPKQKAILEMDCSDKAFIEKFKERIEKETNTEIKFSKGTMEKLLEREFYIDVKQKSEK